MNLVHLATKRDDTLRLGSGVVALKERHGGRTYTGFRLPPGDVGEVRIRSALNWYPFSVRPPSAHWLAVAEGVGAVRTAYVDAAGQIVAETVDTVGAAPSVMHLPVLPDTLDLNAQKSLDLVISNVSPSAGPISLLVTETVPTEEFYDRAVGLGVEIGPGPNPRILPREGRTVYYVERETADEFKAKYGFRGQFESLDSPEARAFWDQVTLGRANALPFDDGSLDFIFSADVVEHLVNPLGHFAYWHDKLAPGGKILAIIPHIYGCGDYRNRPTPLSDWLAQYEKGGFEETVEHHRPYAEARGIDPQSLLDREYSSHFSFFTTENLSRLLEVAVARLGYAGFNVYHGRNAKKIHFTLYK